MKPLAILLICTPLIAAELDGNVIKLTPEEAQRCSAGCVVMTLEALRRIVERVQICRREDWT